MPNEQCSRVEVESVNDVLFVGTSRSTNSTTISTVYDHESQSCDVVPTEFRSILMTSDLLCSFLFPCTQFMQKSSFLICELFLFN